MATDFNNKLGMPSPMIVGTKATSDLPLDVRTRIETIDEMEQITFPFIGMMVYVKDEDKFYVVKTLKGAETKPGIAATYTENYLIDTYEEFAGGAGLPEDVVEALGVPYKEAIPEIPGTAVAEHYDNVAQGTEGALEVVADDYEMFEPTLHIKVSDANALVLPGISFEVGDYALHVPAVEGTETTPAVPEQEATGLFKTVREMAADASVLASDINVFGIGEIGGVKDGDIFAMGSTLDDVVKQIFQATPTGVPAVYTQPEVTISMDPVELEQEVGTTLAPVINATFVQNDAGMETSRVYSPINAQQQDSIQIIEGDNTEYSVTINYAEGPQKLDSVGLESGDPIPAGAVTASCKYVGYRNMFFGGDKGTEEDGLTSDEVRALPNQIKVGSQDVIEFKVPIGTTRVIAAIPTSVSLDSIVYVEQGADYTDMFYKGSAKIYGLNNVLPGNYWVYVYAIPVALEGVMTFKVTLG